ncbi:MAG: hypothetical protein AB1700_16425 [Bacillota bacterium]
MPISDFLFAALPLLSLGLALKGGLSRRPGYLVSSTAVLLPFTVYFLGCPPPRFIVAGLGMLLLPLAAALTCRRWARVTWGLLFPFFGLVAWVLVVTIRNATTQLPG